MSVPQSMEKASAVAQIESGASWFTWIAGLSVINSILALSGATFGFMLGLGLTEVFNAVGHGMGGGAKAIILVLDLLVAGVWVLFGIQAKKGKNWAFIAGMIFYTLDGILTALLGQYFGAAFHAYALFRIYGGFSASQRLKAILQMEAQQQGMMAGSGVPQPGVWPPPPQQ